MPLTHTISLVEVIWTLVSVIGCFYVTKLFSKALGDWVTLKLNRINSIREFAARVVVLTYALLTIVEFGFVLAGVFAMASPSPMVGRVSPVSYALTGDFLTLDVLLTGGAYIIEHWRQQLIRKIREIDDLDWYYDQKDKQEGVHRHGE
jgi:hypothetical protein